MTPSLFDLTGKVALVTGAAQGMGRAMALALAEAGAHLMLVDRNEAGAHETAIAAKAMGRSASVARCDVSNPAEIRELFATHDRAFGRIDFLGNVAGDGILGAPESISLEDVERCWRNLVLGRFCMCQEAGRRMLTAGRGSIVNIGSLASLTALGRGHVAYSMAVTQAVWQCAWHDDRARHQPHTHRAHTRSHASGASRRRRHLGASTHARRRTSSDLADGRLEEANFRSIARANEKEAVGSASDKMYYMHVSIGLLHETRRCGGQSKNKARSLVSRRAVISGPA